MEKVVLCLCFVTVFVFANSADSYMYRQKRSPYPHRAVMFSGYYGHPARTSYDYLPAGAMTAFATGQTVSSNSFAGEQDQVFDSSVQQYEPQNTKKEHIPEATLDEATAEELEEEVPVKPPQATKRKQKKQKSTPKDDEEESEEEEQWPLRKSGRRDEVPFYNAFFPIMFGGYSGSRSRSAESEGAYPGAATAIANSFSTGKGGVATSHATSYGDPYLSTLLRSGNFNFKKTPAHKD